MCDITYKWDEKDDFDPNVSEFMEFYEAIKECDVGVVRSVLQKTPDPSTWGKRRRYVNIFNLAPREMSPVNLAAKLGHVDILHLLISSGFSTRESTKHNPRQPIHHASIHGHVEVVKTLILTYDVAVDSPDRSGNTSLCWAVRGGSEKMVRYLVEAGACVNHRNKLGQSSLHLAAEKEWYHICKYLISQRADLDSRDSEGRTPLHISAGLGNVAIVTVLLDAGADINVSSEWMYTPFLEALKSNNLRLVRLMSRRGAYVDAVTSDGVTALHLALTSEDTSYRVLRYLLVELNLSPLAPCLKQAVTKRMCWGEESMVELLYSIGCCVYPDSCHLPLRLEEVDDYLELARAFCTEDHVYVTSARLGYLRRVSSCPRTLSQLACLTLRWTMGRRVSSAVDCLSLPQKLKDFVKLSHIVTHTDDDRSSAESESDCESDDC